MFQSISWQHFLIGVALIFSIYYLAVLILCYWKSISDTLSRRLKSSHLKTSKMPYRSDSVMGLTYEEKQQVTTRSEEIMVAADPVQTDSDKTDRQTTLLLGSVADFLREVKILIQVTSEAQGTKEDFLSLFQSLIDQYQSVLRSPYQNAIRLFVIEACREGASFQLSASDLETFLSQATSKQSPA